MFLKGCLHLAEDGVGLLFAGEGGRGKMLRRGYRGRVGDGHTG